jgi:GNAT superfamily N-acetyltransferase
LREIVELKSVGENINELSEMLIKVVEDGASIGFLPPLNLRDAKAYWETVNGDGILLFTAKIDGTIAGSVQLHLNSKQNGSHRTEIAKLMTHPDFRRKGLARFAYGLFISSIWQLLISFLRQLFRIFPLHLHSVKGYLLSLP